MSLVTAPPPPLLDGIDGSPSLVATTTVPSSSQLTIISRHFSLSLSETRRPCASCLSWNQPKRPPCLFFPIRFEPAATRASAIRLPVRRRGLPKESPNTPCPSHAETARSALYPFFSVIDQAEKINAKGRTTTTDFIGDNGPPLCLFWDSPLSLRSKHFAEHV